MITGSMILPSVRSYEQDYSSGRMRSDRQIDDPTPRLNRLKVKKAAQNIDIKNIDGAVPYDDEQESTAQETDKVKKYPAALQEDEKQSMIENMFNTHFSGELNEPLTQFGYQHFRKEVSEHFLPVGDDYIVGPGDTLKFYFWGDSVDIMGLRGFYTITVDREGKAYIPGLGAFHVWGLGVSGVKKTINSALSKKFTKYEIEISLGKLREFPVYLSGYVKNPGMIPAIGTYSVFDILTIAGGVEKNGSLRNIQIIRNGPAGSPITINVDLYDFLIHGKPVNIRVKEGDSICVNPIGNVAALYGVIKRPGIYEIKEDSTVKQLIDMGGGILPSAYSHVVKLMQYVNNEITIKEMRLNEPAFLSAKLKEGDFIKVQGLYSLIGNNITVTGSVGYTGDYSYSENIKLSGLLPKIGLLPDTNMELAEIYRDDAKEVINFSPADVLNSKTDVELKKGDRIAFFPKWVYEPIEVAGEIENPRVINYSKKITLLNVLKYVRYKTDVSTLKAEIYRKSYIDRDEKEKTDYKVISQMKDPDRIKNEDEDIDKISLKESKNVKEQLYLLEKKRAYISVYLYDLLIKTSAANIELQPGDRVLIKKIDPLEKTRHITILGEVKNPGSYAYARGKRLYDLIVEAGGYTADAYPTGLIFIRSSAKKMQKEQIDLSILTMEEFLAKSRDAFSAAGESAEETKMLTMTLLKQKELLDIIKKKSELGLGRIAIEMPRTIDALKNSPENIEIMDEDYIVVPSRPNYILVLGDVYNQLSIPYGENKTLRYYLNQMGGPAKNADVDNIYVIRSNGKIISKAQYSGMNRLFFSTDWKNNRMSFARDFESMILEEGDAIVVPTEIVIPTMWRPLLRDVAQIIFQSMATLVLARSL